MQNKLIISSAGFTYMLDRLKTTPQNLGGSWPRCIALLTLTLDFHTYAVIAHCAF